MTRQLGTVSGVRRSWAYRSVARVAIAGQLLTMLPATATISAAQSPIASASFATAAAARAARAADEKLAELRLPPGALLSNETPAPGATFTGPKFTAPRGDEDVETLLADYLLWADQRGKPGPSERPDRPAPPRPEPKRVVVNRTVPRVTPRAIAPALSADPVDREFFDARIFAEPLVPIGATTAEDNRALGQALRQYLEGRNRENVSIVLAHLQQFPASPWRASLLANIGTVFSQHGYYTRAFQSWDAAWQLTKTAPDPRARAIADYAIAQWLELMTRFGDVTALEGKLKEVEGRALTGSTGARIRVAREGVWILKNHHEWATPSARTALASWLYVRSPAYARTRARADMSAEAAAEAERVRGAKPLGAVGKDGVPEFRMPKVLTDFHAKAEGTSLRELATLAAASGLNVRPAYRPAGASLVTPAIAHLKPGHYAFVLKQEEGRVLLRDSILGGEIWFTRAALEEESSGYWLINEGPLPIAWRAVQEHEATVVIGRCAPGGADDTDPCGCEGDSGGMATYRFHPVAASLRLADTPVGYVPPRGPTAYFTLTYNHREVLQPSTFTYSNFGPMWTYDWLSYVQEVPLGSSPWGHTFNAYVSVFLRRSGEEQYRNPDVNGVYPAHFKTRAVLVKVSDSPVRYERRLPDGSMEVFTQSNGAPSGERRIFLTSVVDPRGQALLITYDAQLRAVAFTDALGQVTTISYDHPADPLKITKVTDPFGRFATFTYTAAGQLASVTDVIGLTSSFTYASHDFISALTTPYGTTTFRHETTVGYPRMLEATDPLGGTEHLEYHYQNTSIANAETASLVPTGFTAFNENLQYYNTFHWSKRQWALHPGDITKAKRTHWLLHDPNPDDGNHGVALSIPLTVKQPLENTVWYAYPGQGSNRWVGSHSRPERVGRVLDNGTSQITEATYNANGAVLTRTDAVGRRVSYTYAANGIDVLEVRRTTGVLNELLASFGNYTASHAPQTLTDAAGETVTMTFNAAGQTLTLTNAANETTTSTYDALGYPIARTGAIPGSTMTLTYDGFGRVRTSTSSDGYTVTRDYDAFDRPVRVTYPDATYEEYAYDKLHLAARRDRLGRQTRFTRDALGRIVAVRDPLGRVVSQQWCVCGTRDALTDARGATTRWEYDIQNRLNREVRADNSTAVVFTYEAAKSRRKTVTDPKLQVTTYSYYLDDTVQSIAFTNTAVATPTVSFTYDAGYPRKASMTDGTGTTSYAYHPVGSLGAGQLASVDGPLANDTITYVYDELSRITTRAVNGVGQTHTYDALGRMATELNPLGTFTFTYDGTTPRLASVLFPNGQTTEYVYLGSNDDRRLQMIHHKRANSATISKFDYTYDNVGNILTWQQQADNNSPTLWRFAYDEVDQLSSAVRWSTGGSPTVLNRLRYIYDTARNRITEQVDDSATAWTHDVLNRLVQQQGGGQLRFAGTVNEPAVVTLEGLPASVDAGNAFTGTVATTTGTNIVSVQATDSSGNTTSAQYQVTQSGSPRTFTYDANGNVTSDGSRVFEWDARNQLVAITIGTHRSEFTYDGLQHRVRTVERENGVIQSETHAIWCDSDICEERSGVGTVESRLYWYGVQRVSGSEFLLRDHLSSIEAVTNANEDLVVRYSYDPFGKHTQTSGAGSSEHRFTGHRLHEPSGLLLTMMRAYDPVLGRWLSEDPLGLDTSLNLFAYVDNRVTVEFDPYGLQGVNVTCTQCNQQESGQITTAVNKVCANTQGGKCNLVLRQHDLLECFQGKCKAGFPVVCVKPQCDGPGRTNQCGGPCFGDFRDRMYITPRGLDSQSMCGPLTDTVAHELAHMCGIGNDGGPDPSDAQIRNRRAAESVGMACR